MLARTSFRIQGQGQDPGFHYKAKDISFMVKAKAKIYASQVSRPRLRMLYNFWGLVLTRFLSIIKPDYVNWHFLGYN